MAVFWFSFASIILFKWMVKGQWQAELNQVAFYSGCNEGTGCQNNLKLQKMIKSTMLDWLKSRFASSAAILMILWQPHWICTAAGWCSKDEVEQPAHSWNCSKCFQLHWLRGANMLMSSVMVASAFASTARRYISCTRNVQQDDHFQSSKHWFKSMDSVF